MPRARRLLDRRPAHETVLFVLVRSRLVLNPEFRIGCRRVRVGTGPEAERYPALVPLSGMVPKSDVQLGLELRLLRPVALQEPEE
jgi:hypothetical protein